MLARNSTAALARIGPAKPVAPNANKMAELLSVISGAAQAKIKHVLLLIEPFTYATIFELAALVSFGFAFGSRRRRATVALPRSDSLQSSFPVSEPVEFPKRATVSSPVEFPATVSLRTHGNHHRNRHGNRGDGGNPVFSKVEAEADLVTRLALGETVAAQGDLGYRWGVHKATVSKWVAEWERRQLIPTRKQFGRCKQLAKA